MRLTPLGADEVIVTVISTTLEHLPLLGLPLYLYHVQDRPAKVTPVGEKPELVLARTIKAQSAKLHCYLVRSHAVLYVRFELCPAHGLLVFQPHQFDAHVVGSLSVGSRA